MIFFSNSFVFEKSSEGQTAWIQIKPDILFAVRLSADDTIFANIIVWGAQWLSGIASPASLVVVLEQDTFILA